MYQLRYKPDSPMDARFPSWRFGQRRTREAAEATRLQCVSVDQIEVVECDESAAVAGETGPGDGKIGAQHKTAPGTRSANCESGSQGLANATEERQL